MFLWGVEVLLKERVGVVAFILILGFDKVENAIEKIFIF